MPQVQPQLSTTVTTCHNTLQHHETSRHTLFLRCEKSASRSTGCIPSRSGFELKQQEATVNSSQVPWKPPQLHRASPCFTAADDSLAAMAVVPQGGPGGPPAPAGCEVRAANPPKGFGLFACAPCPAYSNLFTEDTFGQFWTVFQICFHFFQ